MRRVADLLVALVLIAGCGGSGDDPAGSDVPTQAGAGFAGATSSVVGDPGGTDALRSIFPLPSGTVSEVMTYTVTDDGGVRTETASFEVAGLPVESVVTYYTAILGNMGYVLDPLRDGEAVSLEVMDPADVSVKGTLRLSPSGSAVRIDQARTAPRTEGA